MRVRGYPDNLVNKVLAEVKFTERKLVSLAAVFLDVTQRAGERCVTSKKRLLRRLKESRLFNKNPLSSKRIKMPFVTQYNPSVPNPKNILMSKWHLIEITHCCEKYTENRLSSPTKEENL